MDRIGGLRLLCNVAEQGFAPAQASLGCCAYAKKNLSNAVEWWRKVANQSHAQAQYLLGNAIEHGRGVDKDEYKAVIWYRKAAEKGLPEGQYALAYCYIDGKGVRKDKSKAVKWFRRAVEQDHFDA